MTLLHFVGNKLLNLQVLHPPFLSSLRTDLSGLWCSTPYTANNFVRNCYYLLIIIPVARKTLYYRSCQIKGYASASNSEKNNLNDTNIT
jgi:hypothetical protein